MNPSLNDLLASLPENEYRVLTEKMELVSLNKGQTLFDVGQVTTQLYFPVGAIVSMMNDMPDGDSVETYVLGKICFVGLGATGTPSFYRATVRNAGLAYRIAVGDIQRVLNQCPVYLQRVNQGIQGMLRQMSQSIYCAKRHGVEQQLLRWMLTTLDRTLSNQIAVTHQELSDLLCVRREAVSLAMRRLAEAGWVSNSRGVITVLDRSALEAIACDCYWLGLGIQRPLPEMA